MAAYDKHHLCGSVVPLRKTILVLFLVTGTLISLRLVLGHMSMTFQPMANLADNVNSDKPQQLQIASEQNDGVITKALVVASTTKDNTSWLSQIPSSMNWTLYHYRVDDPISPILSVPVLKGNEAMVYLTYIIDNYDHLPKVVLFHHAHPTAWHQRLSSLAEVTRLRPEYILKAGYANTRCLSHRENVVTLEGGTPGDFTVFPHLDRKTHLVTLLDAFLEPEKGETEIPHKIAAPCCAQFAVTRDRVRGRSKDWWEALRDWVIETPLNSMNSGRLMEHLWHIWFGMPADFSPSLESCQCQVFGMGRNCGKYLNEERHYRFIS